MEEPCVHLQAVTDPEREDISPRTEGCEECLKLGSEWLHLRLCMICGHVGCCDDSPHQHATAHFHETDHPVIKSFEPDERWAYCYVDEQAIDEIPVFADEAPLQHLEAPL